MAYSSDSPQVKAAKKSGENRRRRATERHERDERWARWAAACTCGSDHPARHTTDCAVWKEEA